MAETKMVIVKLKSGQELTLESFHFVAEPEPGLFLAQPFFDYYDPTLNKVFFKDGGSEMPTYVGDVGATGLTAGFPTWAIFLLLGATVFMFLGKIKR